MKIILNVYVKFHFSTFYYSAKVGIMPDYFLCYLSRKRLSVLLDQSDFSHSPITSWSVTPLEMVAVFHKSTAYLFFVIN